MQIKFVFFIPTFFFIFIFLNLFLFIFVNSAAVSNSPWQQRRNDQFGSGKSLFNGPSLSTSSENKLWSTTVDHPFPSSSVITSSGFVISITSIGMVIAFIKDTGDVKWTFVADSSVNSSPILSLDESMLFFGEKEGNINCLNSTDGSLIWKYLTDGRISSSPVISSSNNILFVGTTNSSVYAINGIDGTLVWTEKVASDQAIESSPALNYNESLLFIGSTDKCMYAFNATNGQLKWSFETDGVILSSPAVSSDNIVYFGSNDTKLYAVHGENGTKLWSASTFGAILSSPALSDYGFVFIGSDDGHAYCFNAHTGQAVWNTSLDGSAISFSPIIDSENILYISSLNLFAALNGSNGVIIWSMDVYMSPFGSGASMGLDGTLYLGLYNGSFSAISRCRAGFYCEAGTMFSCPAGTYNSLPSSTSANACLTCPPGFYCPAESVWPVLCSSGKLCPQGSQQELPCPIGKYCFFDCPEAYSNFKCLSHRFIDTAIYTWSVARQYCLSLNYDADLPSVHNANDQNMLSTHYYRNLPKGQFWLGLTIESPSSPAEWSDGSPVNYFKGLAVSFNDPSGYCYNFGAFVWSPLNCDQVYQSVVCVYDAENVVAIAVACPNGTYCPQNSSEPIPCPPGYYCEPGTATPLICPYGYYCPNAATAPILCSNNSFCPEGAVEEITEVLQTQNCANPLELSIATPTIGNTAILSSTPSDYPILSTCESDVILSG